jgi:hypothetical protein
VNDRIHESFVWQTHGYINDYIRLADAKAGALFAIFGVLIGILVRQWTEGDEPATWWRKALFASALFFGALVLLYAVDVVKPRRRRAERGIIYWEDIKAYGKDVYRDVVRQRDEVGLYEAVSAHTYEIAEIAAAKYRSLGRAFLAVYPAVALGLLAIPTL